MDHRTIHFLVILLLLLGACTAKGPQHEFCKVLSERIDELINALEDFGPEKKGDDMISSMPYSIVHGAIGIRRHFESVSVAFLFNDLDGFDNFGRGIKADMRRLQASIKKELERIEEDFNRKPFGYRGDFTLFGTTVSMTDEGKLYFNCRGEGIVLEHYLEFDIDAWLRHIKEKVLAVQQKGKENP